MDQIVIAHISDVHFGDQLFNDRFGFISGWRPHDMELCAKLKDALEDVHVTASLRDNESIHVVLTGDLSQHGSASNFATADTYFHKWTLESSDSTGGLGLGLELPRLPMIPGNHDHWQRPGSILPRPRAYNPKIFPKPFKKTPWHERLASTEEGISLDLFGVDSNSGLAQNRTNLLAQGSISDEEFGKLEALLEANPRSEPNNVRVILCHHALSKRWATFTWVLSPESVQELAQIVDHHGISAVLTGHTHDFLQTVDASDPTTRPEGVVELRSATTLKGPASLHKRQGFWAHRIRFDQSNNSLEWTSWRYQWNGSRFVRTVEELGPWVRFRI